MEQISFLPEPAPMPPPQPIHIGQRVWGCDYGSGYFHLHCDGRYLKVIPEQFAALSFATAGDVIVVENAHMQPKVRSLAQVFTFEQLVAIKAEALKRNIAIRLWFHSQTPKWRAMLGMGDKSDEVDAETVYQIIQHRGLNGLQYFNPRQQYSLRIEWAHEQLKDMNEWLNVARCDYQARNCPAFRLYIKEGRPAAAMLMLKKYSAGTCSHDLYVDCSKWFLKSQNAKQNEHIYGLSLWAAFVRSDGETRKFNGQTPGVKFVMQELLRQRPNHFKGGTARSNIMHHHFRNLAIAELGTRASKTRLHEFKPREKEKFLAFRRRYRKAMTTTLHAMREYLIERDVV
jgi:hypothetical protein